MPTNRIVKLQFACITELENCDGRERFRDGCNPIKSLGRGSRLLFQISKAVRFTHTTIAENNAHR